MTYSFEGKVAVITGGGNGIGAAVARAFAEAGAQVVIVDISVEAGEAGAAEIRARGGESLFIQADVRDEASVMNYVARATEKFGAIDAFFNNAGIEGSIHPITDYPTEDFDRLMAINLRGMFLGLKHVLKVMMPRKSGSIINTSSVSGLRGSAGMCAYVTSKHAILGLTKCAAIEAAKVGVRVNAICPGPIDTRMIHSIEQMTNPDKPSAVTDMIIARNPSGRYGSVTEIAQAVLFLASDACPYLNGESIAIDGARTAA